MDVGDIVAGRFRIVRTLSQGPRSLHVALDSNHKIYFLKAEESIHDVSSVKNEALMYWTLRTSLFLSPVLGIPPVFYYGSHLKNGVEHHVLVMEYLERSLHDKMEFHGGNLSLKSVLMEGIQMLRILEDIHSRGIIHRDIKPENILTGPCETDISSLYLCDFGIAKRIAHEADSFPDSKSTAADLYGTREFASRRALDLKEQGRSDALESLFYTLMFLKYGSLPWLDPSFPPDLKYAGAIREVYYNSVWGDLPPQIKMYWQHIKSLRVEEKPDYNYLTFLLNNALICAGMRNDGEFEWSPPALDFRQWEEEEEEENVPNKIPATGLFDPESVEYAKDPDKIHSPVFHSYSEKEAEDPEKI